MKNLEINKTEIARIVNQINNGSNGNVPSIIRKVDDAICWAWNNWDEDVISTYYQFKKPELPNEEFISNWVENEDFEADGFDLEQLAEL